MRLRRILTAISPIADLEIRIVVRAGIVVALIGCSNAFGVFVAGLFYGALMYGGSKLNLVGAPTQLINVIVGTVVFFIAISVIFRNLKRLKRTPKTGKEAMKA